MGDRRAPRGSPPLFTQELLSFLLALAVLFTLLAGAFAAGIGWSIRGWNEVKGSHAARLLESLVLASYRSRGELESEAIAAATLPSLEGSAYLRSEERRVGKEC